jgi:hypothetical protein
LCKYCSRGWAAGSAAEEEDEEEAAEEEDEEEAAKGGKRPAREWEGEGGVTKVLPGQGGNEGLLEVVEGGQEAQAEESRPLPRREAAD